jgi:hypothetical protein
MELPPPTRRRNARWRAQQKHRSAAYPASWPEASGEGFKALGTLQMPAEGRYWTAPAFSGGRIFVRNAAGDGFCVDVRK